MPLESGTYVYDLDPTNPLGTDLEKYGDDHLRLIKTTLKNTFPNANGPVTFNFTGTGSGVAFTNVANTWPTTQTFTAGIGISLDLTKNDAFSGPDLNVIRRNNARAVGDVLGRVMWYGNNTTGGLSGLINYGQISVQITDPTAATEDGILIFGTIVNGVPGSRISIGQGLYTAGVSGGDKGIGSINAATLWEGGTALTAKYGQLNAANVWAAASQTLQFSGAGALNITDISATHTGAIGNINFYANNTTPASVNAASIVGRLDTNTAGAENGRINLNTIIAGVIGTRIGVGAG